MKERPILFSGPMVRAILDGRKTQTRRPIRSLRHPYGHLLGPEGVAREFNAKTESIRCPLGQPGDRLWVRETWTKTQFGKAVYKADSKDSDGFVWPSVAADVDDVLWRPSIHMPRWASRITLEITRVWVERVQDITEEDAMKEGCIRELKPDGSVGWGAGLVEARDAFRDLWQSIYGTWDANPWVWAVEFRRTK